jgi:plastocyanin
MRSSAGRVAVLAIATITLVLVAVSMGTAPRPYVVTAIDYHFHDAHPTLPIGPGRDLVVKNQGRNLHNVTIPELGYSRNVRPGDQLEIDDIADKLMPGRYVMFCSIHRDRGMSGVIVIAQE